MPSSPPRKHRFFSPVSYLALSYIAYVVLSSVAFQFFASTMPTWLAVGMYWTWQPFTYPFSVCLAALGSTITGVLLGIVLGVLDVYFWAWLICRLIATRHRTSHFQSNDRDPNAV